MVDDFFEGALDGCSAVAGIALAILCALLFVQLLFAPVFWIVAGAGLLVWTLARLGRPGGAGQEPPLSGSPRTSVVAPISGYRSSAPLPIRTERAPEEREREEIPDLLVPVPLVFAAGEPSVFYPPEAGIPYRGHLAAKKRLDRAIESVPIGSGLRVLLIGRVGIGRGTLATITAARLQAWQQGLGMGPGSYYVLPAERIRSRAQLELFMRQLRPRDIVYLEDLERLQQKVGAQLLLTLFRDGAAGATIEGVSEAEGGPGAISWIASARGVGPMEEAVRRALRPQIRLRDPSPDVLVEILGDREMEIHPDAAYEIAERAAPSPARALGLYAEAKEFAVAEDCPMILPGHVRDALEVLGVEE